MIQTLAIANDRSIRDLVLPLGPAVRRDGCERQLIVVTHSEPLIVRLADAPGAGIIRLEKELGATRVAGQPTWRRRAGGSGSAERVGNPERSPRFSRRP